MPIYGTLFHAAVSQVQGDAILPLNQMRDSCPDLYARRAAKYVGREGIASMLVSPLGCTWGDVVFLSPVDPAPLFAALARGGRRVPKRPAWTIDASALDPDRCCIRLMRVEPGAVEAHTPDEDDWLPLTTATLRAVSEVSLRAIRRLESIGPDEPWLPWGDVPHVLHRGPIPARLFRSEE